MRTLKPTLLFLMCLGLLSACGLNFDTSEVENIVDDVSEDLGLRPTNTPTPDGGPPPTPTRTPQATLIPTFTPEALGTIQTGAGPSASGSSPEVVFEVVEVTLSGEVYVVQPGDTLGEIAQQFDVTLNELFSANQDLIVNEDLIEVGWELQIPE